MNTPKAYKAILDRRDVTGTIPKEDMVPALVLCNRKADVLIKTVVESALVNLEDYNRTGVIASTDYALFTGIGETAFDVDDELTGDIPYSQDGTVDHAALLDYGSRTSIDRLIHSAERLLIESGALEVTANGDCVTVSIVGEQIIIEAACKP